MTEQITFECADCGEIVTLSSLSRGSVKRAGSTTRSQALMVLDPAEQVCQFCEDDESDSESYDAEHFRGRTDVERFEFSGLTPDPARLQAYLNSN